MLRTLSRRELWLPRYGIDPDLINALDLDDHDALPRRRARAGRVIAFPTRPLPGTAAPQGAGPAAGAVDARPERDAGGSPPLAGVPGSVVSRNHVVSISHGSSNSHAERVGIDPSIREDADG